MHLGTRDCSTQRNNQKLIEEAPAVVEDCLLLERMCTDARKFGTKMGLRGLATAEFLYDPTDQKYSFLEVNPRLQVEHPATELAYGGINLPEILFRIARGELLADIEPMRRYGNTMPFRHTMAVRICSENPHENFAPSTGAIHSIQWTPATSNDWGYFSIVSRGYIGGNADSQFGHLFSSGETREDARGALARSIERLKIDCAHFTSAAYMRTILDHEAFKAMRHHTKWIQTIVAEPSMCTSVIYASILDAYLQLTMEQDVILGAMSHGHTTSAYTTGSIQIHKWSVVSRIVSRCTFIPTEPVVR